MGKKNILDQTNLKAKHDKVTAICKVKTDTKTDPI